MALRGIRVVEMLGLAPGPFCGKILADFGATVTVVQKIDSSPFDVMSNGKRMLSVNLKTEEGVQVVRKLCSKSDVLIDTFRPGVLEKLGLGPDSLMKANERLIIARITGYGQTGYYKDKAGHDINYVAMSGLLSQLGKVKQPPSPPLNLLADFGGGSLSSVIGILLALYERTISGKGQVIDVSMTEGAAYLGSWVYKSRNLPIWSGEPGTNLLDGGFPFYCSYATKDNKFMAVGALEPQFYTEFLKGLNLSETEYNQMSDLEKNKEKFKETFLTKTQEEWTAIFEKLDACVTPVLDFESVSQHRCNQSRDSFLLNEDGLPIPQPAPKLARTAGETSDKYKSPQAGEHTTEVLIELGYDKTNIRQLVEQGHVYIDQKSKL